MVRTVRKDRVRMYSNIAGVLAVAWMCVIFAFSAQTKEESSVVSEGLSYRMASATGLFFHLNIDEETLRAIEHLIRKSAHMTEFAILAVLIFIWLGRWQMIRLRRTVGAMALASLYACTDEFHQLFVEGRAGLLSDVLVDSLGAVIGVLVFLLIGRGIKYVSVFRGTMADTGQESHHHGK